jgi:hypothetical protein
VGGGVKWCSWRAYEGGRERKKKGSGGVNDALYRHAGGRGRRGGSRAESTWKRDGRREGAP